MSSAAIPIHVDMLVELLAGIAAGALGIAWTSDRRALARRMREIDTVRALPLELALWWIEQQPRAGELRSPRRMAERIAVAARLVGAPADVAVGASLAAALPPGALGEGGFDLPASTRDALAYRHARWDGRGIPPDVRGDAIPLAGQLLALAEWLEARDGATPSVLEAGLRAEAGHRFSAALVATCADHMRELLAASAPDAHLGLRVTAGTLLCITPEGLDTMDPAPREALLRAVETRVRGRLRPTDRVYCTDRDVVAWLGNTGADGALAVIERLRPVLEGVPVPSISRGTADCAVSIALADTDGTSFSDLLAVARDRGGRRAA